MVIYEGLGHSQPTTASRMIQKVSKNRAVALLPRFRPISRWFPPKFPNRKNEWNFGAHYRSWSVWWSYTVLYGLGRPGRFSGVLWGVKRASSPLSWKLPIRYSQMFLQFRTLRCSRIYKKKKLTDRIQKKLMFLKDRDLIQTMLLEWRKSIDTCCEDCPRKIPVLRYPLLTYSLKYLPSYLTLLLEMIMERFFWNPDIMTALCGWNLDRNFWVFLQMLNDFKTISFRSRNKPPIGPELIHFHQKCISSKIFAKTLLEMMSLIILYDFEIFQFSPENSKFPIQTQLRGATRIEKQTETNPDRNTL